MTIEEAIEKEKSIAKSNHELANSYHTDFNVYMRQGGACRERAEYHEQVAEWLEELQRLKEQEPCVDCISRHAVLETIDNRIEQIKRDANEINKSYSHLSFAEGIHDGYCRLKCDLRILSSVKPQEPCGKDINVPATDAISRQMAIDALGECPMNWTDSDDEITAERDWKDTVEMLKSLPSVTPQPRSEVLDKIRAEIEQEYKAESEHPYGQGLSRTLQIIDKYKSESEDKKNE